MTRKSVVFVAFCAALCAACGTSGNFNTSPDSSTAPGTQVRLWAENHPLIASSETVLDGCRAWWPNDVDCVLTDAFDSTIRINAVMPEDVASSTDQGEIDRANCAKLPDGTVTLGMATEGGWIELYPKCFENLDKDGKVVGYDTFLATAVITHEVGHELGLPHVPKDCDRNTLVVPGHGAICGDAIMNPILDRSTFAPTQVDDIAFHVFVDEVQLPSSSLLCELRMYR